MGDQPRGTVTFLFTDIEGSTELVRKLGERYVDTLAEHRQLVRAAFAEHEGWEIDTQGDAFFVAFDRVGDATLAAADIQRALAARPSSAEASPRVRIGLHTTEIYQQVRESVIARQQEELIELSTPVVELWPGVLALPQPARALDPDKPLDAYTVEIWGARNGLPSSFVRAISQTPDGYP